MPRRKANEDMSPFGIVGRVLSRDARMLSRVARAEDATVAKAIELALRDPERVRKFVDGLLPEESGNQIPA